MQHDIQPVIRRQWDSADLEATVIATVADRTSYTRGLGRHGERVRVVELTCPCCGHEETIRSEQVIIDGKDNVSYWCLNPACRYFVSDELRHATKTRAQFAPDTPMVWDNTAICPDCERRHTVTLDSDHGHHIEDGIVRTARCDACEDSQSTSEVSA